MTIFYVDTTSKYLYAGIVQDDKLVIEKKECLSHDLSTYTLNEISIMFDDAHLTPNDVDKIIVANGPGSFTGIRIGVTLAKIFAWCKKCSITTISSLEAMAKSIKTDNLVVPIIDARRGACYAAIYDGNEEILKGEYLTLEKLNLILKGLGKKYVFITNDKFGFETVSYNPDILEIVRSYQDRKEINPHMVNPMYLKLTEAEENRMKEVNE